MEGAPMQRAPAAAREVLCVGEVLWDALPAGLFVGGAPFNVAGHRHAEGVPVGMVSRVGCDRLGAEALALIAAANERSPAAELLPTHSAGGAGD